MKKGKARHLPLDELVSCNVEHVLSKGSEYRVSYGPGCGHHNLVQGRLPCQYTAYIVLKCR